MTDKGEGDGCADGTVDILLIFVELRIKNDLIMSKIFMLWCPLKKDTWAYRLLFKKNKKRKQMLRVKQIDR